MAERPARCKRGRTTTTSRLPRTSAAAYVGVTRTGYSGGVDTYGGFAVYDVTSFVQMWANGTPIRGFCTYDSAMNYGVLYSETAKGADYQPVLVIDYDQHGTPNAVTNLAAGSPDWFKLDLTWTAPTANPPGAVSRYDIRMSTSAITDDASFDAATQLTGVPTPAAPGTAERFTVTGLAANTTYYFAMKSYDVINTVSPMSNVASGTTNPLDMVAPAQITTLTAPNVKPNYATLTWTAVGDDGVTGVAAGYDLRYQHKPDRHGYRLRRRYACCGHGSPQGTRFGRDLHDPRPDAQYELPGSRSRPVMKSRTGRAPVQRRQLHHAGRGYVRPQHHYQPEGLRRPDYGGLPELDGPIGCRHGGHGGL